MERRTPGPNIDAIFTIPYLNDLEFFVMELTGAPTAEDFEHFLGDRNKIAKCLKHMFKHIISLGIGRKSVEDVKNLKLFALQIYSKFSHCLFFSTLALIHDLLENECFIYSMSRPLDDMYIFTNEFKFFLPTLPALLSHTFPRFMTDIWKLKVSIEHIYGKFTHLNLLS